MAIFSGPGVIFTWAGSRKTGSSRTAASLIASHFTAKNSRPPGLSLSCAGDQSQQRLHLLRRPREGMVGQLSIPPHLAINGIGQVGVDPPAAQVLQPQIAVAINLGACHPPAQVGALPDV